MSAQPLTAPTPYPLPVASMSYPDLMAALARVSLAFPARPFIPAMRGVLFDIDDTGTATLTAHSGEASVRTPIATGTDRPVRPGRALIPLRRLLQVLKATERAARTSPVTLDCTRPGWVVAEIGDWAIPMEALDVGAYPPVPYITDGRALPQPQVAVLGASMKTALAFVAPFASRAEHAPKRAALRAVRLRSTDGRIHLVASDQFRLHSASVETSGRLDSTEWMIPAPVATAWGRHLTSGQWDLSVADNGYQEWFIVRDDAGTTIAVIPPSGTYPKVDTLWPVTGRSAFTVARAELRELVRVAHGLSTGTRPPLKLVIARDGDTAIAAVIPDAGEPSDDAPGGWTNQYRAPSTPVELSGPWALSGAEVNLNPEFALRMLESFTTQRVAISLDGTRPVCVAATPEDLTDPDAIRALLMPVRPAAGVPAWRPTVTGGPRP